MINLLPPDIKSEYRYAQRNVALIRWVVTGAIVLVGIGIIGSYGWLSLRQATLSSQKQAAALQTSLDHAQLKQTNAHVTEISNSIKLVEKVLGQEILFSKLLKQMATALPNGTILAGLNIPAATSGSALDVTVDAVNSTAATQVQVNLSDPKNQIFASADIESVTCNAGDNTNPQYPCEITLRTQFAPNNQFLFINQGSTKS